MRPRRQLYRAIKRFFDIYAALTALLILSPIMGATYLLILILLGQPVIFRQVRPGKNGQTFTLLKFRTMLNANMARGVETNEQRITTLGKTMRALSVDELPSLWNVVKGDMSLVGPRPLLVKYLPLYTAHQNRRHEVKPGLTGLAQVSGRNTLDWPSRFELDVHYVDNRSCKMDIHILMLTIKKVLLRDGINSEGHAVGAPFEGNAPGKPGSSG